MKIVAKVSGNMSILSAQIVAFFRLCFLMVLLGTIMHLILLILSLNIINIYIFYDNCVCCMCAKCCLEPIVTSNTLLSFKTTYIIN